MKHNFPVYILSFLYCFNLNASNFDYIFPYSAPSYSNYGTLGLIQNPNARFHEEGTLAFNWTKAEPYTRGSILAYPFNWLEATYYYTDIDNALYSRTFLFSGNQTYKDKGFEFKLKLSEETKLYPAIAVGVRDPAGTGRFSAEYLVASKRFYNLDATIGIGWGGLGGGSNKISNPMTNISDRFRNRNKITDGYGGEFNTDSFFSGKEAGFFGGIEYVLPNLKGARIKLEYDSTDYRVEGFPFGSASDPLGLYPVKQPDSRINFGVMIPFSNRFQFSLGIIKGNTLSLGFSMNGPFGRKNPFFSKNDKASKVENAEIVKRINTRREDLFTYRTSLLAMNKNNISLKNADIDGEKLTLVYSQSQFTSYMQANGRITDVLSDILPDRIKKLELINTNAGLGLYSVTIQRDLFKKYQETKSINIIKKYTKIESVNLDDREFAYKPNTSYPTHFWKLTPSLRSQIGGPDGFYFGDLRLAFHSELQLAKNISILTNVSTGIYDNFDELKLASDSVLPHVRTEIVNYLKQSRDLAINRIQINYFKSRNKNFYYKFSAGYLESMFAGAGGEFLYRPFNSNISIGAELWRVKQREYDIRFKTRDYSTTTGHINLYYRHAPSKVLVTLRGGRFLARDSGINFDFSRTFDNGLRIGAFFSQTDISEAEFGEGSFDKGFYFFIPIDSFFTNYRKGVTGFGLRPLTRDGAAILHHGHSLFGVTDQGQRYNVERGWDWLYD